MIWKNLKFIKTFDLSTKSIASDSDIVEAFKPMDQNILMKYKKSASKDWIVWIKITTFFKRQSSYDLFQVKWLVKTLWYLYKS